MKIVVHKYGGTSVGSIKRIKNVAARVAKWHDAGYCLVIVLSAMSGETNRLISLAEKITLKPNLKDLDMLLSTGEQVSVALLSIALQNLGKSSISLTGWQVPICTNNIFSKARIESINEEKIKLALNENKIVIITGFQGVDKFKNITTLGRGGSDTSAVAVAASLEAMECLIYSDVEGIYTTDPRIVSNASRLSTVTFEEILEMSSLGSKVLQKRSLEFAGNYRVPTRVLSSFTDPQIPIEEEINSGTLISFEDESTMEQANITGIAFNKDEAKITIKSVPDHPGIAYQILGPISDANIEVDMIIQNQSFDGKTDFTFTVARTDYKKSLNIINNHVKNLLKAKDVFSDKYVSKVSVIGVGMRSHVGIASQMFKTLFEEGINIQMISTSEIKISVLIDEKYMELAVRALHKAFELEKKNGI